MDSSGENCNWCAFEDADQEFAGMALRRGPRPARNITIVDLDRSAELTRETAQSAAEYNADQRPQLRASLDGGSRACDHRSIPAMHADMKLAIVPAITARRPSRA